MNEFESFICHECGGRVVLGPCPTASRRYRADVAIPLPADLDVPHCEKCGEVYLDQEEARRVDARLKVEYLNIQAAHATKLVTTLCERHGVKRPVVEAVCGVTKTYLAHVMAGRKEASVTLMRLLESFVMNAAEFDRHLSRTSFDEAQQTALKIQDKSYNWQSITNQYATPKAANQASPTDSPYLLAV